jgi:hypothetical protein
MTDTRSNLPDAGTRAQVRAFARLPITRLKSIHSIEIKNHALNEARFADCIAPHNQDGWGKTRLDAENWGPAPHQNHQNEPKLHGLLTTGGQVSAPKLRRRSAESNKTNPSLWSNVQITTRKQCKIEQTNPAFWSNVQISTSNPVEMEQTNPALRPTVHTSMMFLVGMPILPHAATLQNEPTPDHFNAVVVSSMQNKRKAGSDQGPSRGRRSGRNHGLWTTNHGQRSGPTDCPTTPAGIAWDKSLFRKPKRAVRKVGQAFQPDSDRSGPKPMTAGVRLECHAQ